MNSPLGSPPDVRQCFQLHVCQVEREPAWIATRHVTKKVCCLLMHAHLNFQGQTLDRLKLCAHWNKQLQADNRTLHHSASQTSARSTCSMHRRPATCCSAWPWSA